jgi:hypothetical protein
MVSFLQPQYLAGGIARGKCSINVYMSNSHRGGGLSPLNHSLKPSTDLKEVFTYVLWIPRENKYCKKKKKERQRMWVGQLELHYKCI